MQCMISHCMLDNLSLMILLRKKMSCAFQKKKIKNSDWSIKVEKYFILGKVELIISYGIC